MSRNEPTPIYGLRKTVQPKDRVPEYEICKTAKAGLETVIDLRSASNVLKTTEKDSKGLTIRKPKELKGSHTIRLVHIKGSRKLQMRLVEPKSAVLNNNDSYVIITPTKVVVWNGRISSIMKKAKAEDFAKNICKMREFGCCCPNFRTFNHFGKTINLSVTSLFNDEPIEMSESVTMGDSEYEDIIKLNKIYEIVLNEKQERTLEFNTKISGKPLKKSYLENDKAYFLDFGTELYLWLGSKYQKSENKEESKLVVDFAEHSIVPFEPQELELIEKLRALGYYFPDGKSPRPNWVTVERLNERCESLLFKKKFFDWPDIDIKPTAAKTNILAKKRSHIPINECYSETVYLDYILLGTVINRGSGGRDPENGFTYSIQTEKVAVFRLVDMNFVPIEDDIKYFFFSEEAFLIEWTFMYQRSDIKTLGGQNVETENTGKKVSVYFYWQGRDCSVTEKGISAVLTIHYVNKKASQVHIGQDNENPAFINLFNSRYVSGIGRFNTFDVNNSHLYLIRGNPQENEGMLLELKPQYSSLRSRGSFLYVVPKIKTIFHWIGGMSNKNIVIDDYVIILQKLFKIAPNEYTVVPVQENRESEDFRQAFDLKPGIHDLFETDVIQFCCMFRKKDQYNVECVKISSPLFQIKNFKGKPVLYDKFPINQSDLYSLIQPVLVLLCTNQRTYLWHGWISQKEAESEDPDKKTNFNVLKDRNFLEMKNYVVEDLMPFLKEHMFCEQITQIHAGIETNEFTQLFPSWKVYQDIFSLQIKLGRRPDEGSTFLTEDMISEKIFFSLETLLKRPLPENVNPDLLENYLEDSDFQKVFNMSRSDYNKLPQWKQLELKKTKKLF